MPQKEYPPKFSIQPYSGATETVNIFFEQLQEVQQMNNYSKKYIIAIFKSKIQDKVLTFYLDAIADRNSNTLTRIKEEFVIFFF